MRVCAGATKIAIIGDFPCLTVIKDPAMSDHESTSESSKLPKALVPAVLALVFILLGIAFAANFIPDEFMGGAKKVDETAILARIRPVAHVEFAAAAAGAGGAKAPRTGEQLVNSVCSACHGTGAAGAPKIGDKAAWAPRIAQGLPAMVKIAMAGKNAMPPKGGSDASELELTRAIVYMADKSGANFKDPVAK